MRHRFSPLEQGFGQGNFKSDEVFLSTLETCGSEAIVKGIIDNINHPALNWKHVVELKKRTSLPVLLKDILHPEDALLAMEHVKNG